MPCTTVTVTGTTLTTKAVEFGEFWAKYLTDVELKIIAKVGILQMGDELTNEPVYRQNSKAYVVFTPSAIKYTSISMGSGILKILQACFAWAKANPTKFALLLASFAYISIKIIDWQTKAIEADVEQGKQDLANNILNDPNMNADQKLAALMKLFEISGGMDWGLVIIGVAATLGAAYILGNRR